MTVLQDDSPFTAAGLSAFAVAIIGAAATFVIGMLNYRRQGQSLRMQQEYQDHQLALMRSAQVTDRFTRAIEQLGNESSHVRMGGIFALERIARDSPDDRQYVVDTLAAFVRGRLPAADVGDGGYVRILRLRAPDAQAALTVLCRSPLADDRVASPEAGGLDLSRTDLRRADLQGARLDGASLWAARLEGADLRGAHLRNSILEEANFGRVDPSSERFHRGADLSGADLTGARLDGAYNLDVAMTEGATGWPA
ncbi:pentapeptide repeat-containing protein [Geodermatophilus marinus]|uniref:pentapeptide repeat-containing protein n=1 Tax=Geodermatophilus sp. LHW52908 TaxID=2303986 RepID=UPI000E3BB20B|nr:pentapeptide repeat-containing protein [Geodermatophilus sp. LHW52908]RFU21308.1 pentapeptide repeat-containing protein [Geodermatophilus sp. LHW52908]